MFCDKFFKCFNYIKEDDIWWLFNIKNLLYKRTGGLHIWRKKEYAIFTDIISKLDNKKTVYMRLANSEKNNEDKEKNLSA